MSNKIVSPTWLAVSALNLPPVKAAQKKSVTCAACGINTGDADGRAVKWDISPNFNDYKHLVTRYAEDDDSDGNTYLCTACTQMMGTQMLRLFASKIVTEDGVYPFAKNIHRSWFFLNPPKGQYVVTVSDAQLQHLIWRAPVNFSKKFMRITLGKRDATIVFDRLHRFYKATPDAMALTNKTLDEHFEKKPGTFKLKYPWISSDHEAHSRTHGRMHELFELAVSHCEELHDYYQQFTNLTTGELWAASILLKTPVDEIVKPEPISL